MLAGTVGSSAATHIVREGDSLAKIARKHGVSLGALTKANPGLNPNRIVPGAQVNLPGGARSAQPGAKVRNKPAPETATVSTARSPRQASSENYKVRSGDNLTKISARTGTSVAELMRMNGLRNAADLKAGQTLRVSSASVSSPAPAKPDPRHAVDLTPPTRQGKPAPEYEPERRKPAAAPATGGITHTVRKNENFSTISQQYDVTWSALARANPRVDSTPAPGTVLNVPVAQTVMNEAASSGHRERIPADTAGETDDPGENVRILQRKPAPAPPAQRNAIRVRSTDTIEGIASEFHTDEQTLRQMNNMGPFDKPQSKSVIYVPWPAARPGASDSAL